MIIILYYINYQHFPELYSDINRLPALNFGTACYQFWGYEVQADVALYW